eukprot:9026859-Pyramimonas_sp.AAC.1
MSECGGVPSGEGTGKTFLSNIESRRRRLLKKGFHSDSASLSLSSVPAGGGASSAAKSNLSI